MEQPNIYLDCNRQFAIVKEDLFNNKWTNEFDPIKIPAGSTVTIQNALVNLQGIEGGSIEIREDEKIQMKAAPYLSLSDYLMPKFDYHDPNAIYPITNMISQLSNNPGLIDLYTSYGCLVNTIKLAESPAFQNDLLQSVNYATSDSGTLTAYRLVDFMGDDRPQNQNQIGYSEEPLFPIFIDDNGKIKPKLMDININIPRGVYGITQLSTFITNQMNGEAYDLTKNKNREQVDIEGSLERGEYQGLMVNQCNINTKIWDYDYTINGTDQSQMSVIISEMIDHDMAQLKQLTQSGHYLWVNATDFNVFMELWQQGGTDPTLDAVTLKTIFYMALKQPVFLNPDPKDTAGNPYITLDSAIAEIPQTGPVADKRIGDMFQYNPFDKGFLVGANPQITYDNVSAGFTISNLHRSRQENSHDLIGNKLDNEGQNVSYYKVSKMLENHLAKTTISENSKKLIRNTLLRPRQRVTGLCIYNWDYTAVLESNEANIEVQDRNLTQYSYQRWSDFIITKTELQKVWKTTFWHRLGFDFDQLNDNGYELGIYFDRNDPLWGTTTNNKLDSSVIQSISSLHCGSQSTSDTDYINTFFPQTLLSELKTYDPTYPSSFNLVISNEYTYKSFKNLLYFMTGTYSVLTDSKKITGNRLPQLSDEGYFLITSDIAGHADVVKQKQPVPLLGIVPKSNLSNQDFINSFQEITHIFPQDTVLGKITFEILNADLTAPILNENSSIILKITKNMPIPSTTVKPNKKEEK